MSTFRQPPVALRPGSTSLPSAGTESHRSQLFPTFEQAFVRLRSMAPVTCRNTQEDVSMWYVSKHVCMHCRGWRCDPDCGDWRGEIKRVKRALGTDCYRCQGKDTKVGWREVRLSRHLGFFGWMWQPLCCLIPPTVTVEGLRTSVPFGIVDTTLQHTVELMFADSCECHAVVTVNHGWWGREEEREVLLEWRLKAYIGLHYPRALWSAIYGLNIDRSGDFLPYKTSSHGC